MAVVLLQSADRAEVNQEQLWRHRNLGKAFYENPTTLAQSVDEFRKALALAPESVRERVNYGLALLRTNSILEGVAELKKAQKQEPKLPHTWFNLAIAYKKLRQYDKAVEQFQGMLRLVPDDPISHYNLGLIYKLQDRVDDALREFEITSKLNPDLVAPRFQTFNTYRELDRAEQAEKALAEFRAAKERQAGFDESEDMEWNWYAEVYDPTDAAAEAVPAAGELQFAERMLAGGADPKTAGMASLHSDGGQRLDLLVWSVRGIQLYRGGTDLATESGLAAAGGVLSAAPGDIDNDGLPDLCVLTSSGAFLYRNDKGTFRKPEAPLAAGVFRKAVWLDYDHDYDLDLLLLGDKSVLLRNQGPAGFTDRTADFPFVAGRALDAAVIHLVPDTREIDLAVSFSDREGVLYHDRLLGRYEATPLEGLTKGASSLQQADIDLDGSMDLVFQSGAGVTLLRNRNGRFESPIAMVTGRGPVRFADFEDRAAPDLVAGGSVFRNLGVGKFEAEAARKLTDASALAAGDFNLDGRIDVAAAGADGSVRLYLNETATTQQWAGIRLSGVKNLKVPVFAEVEIKSGALYQKQMYDGSALVFGLRSHPKIDTVRITWANGLVQNQTGEAAGRYLDIVEAPRLSGSCPMIFTWNGRRFEFITDVLGVAPLGARSGDGRFFATDHDEYVQIPGESLVPKDGRYEIRVTEELSEVSYLDKVQLIAVDHSAQVEVYSNEKWKSPPYPEFRLFGVERRVYPRAARDHRGRDVLGRITRRDGVYADTFVRDHAGTAETHAIDLDFSGAAPANRAVLVLNGWVDWADGSVFLAQSQQGGRGLTPPYLQVKDTAGQWRTVIEDMGMPSGKTKTVAVDLSGKFLSRSREVRIVTNMCVYWDEIFLSEDSAAPQARLTPLDAKRADLRFRGFSKVYVHPERRQPERFEYHDVRLASQWNPTPGYYTRYGPVEELVSEEDDRLVVMGSGDELALSFTTNDLPPLPAGWKRDFLLLVGGWAKDRDANTAWSQTVEPLPFHGMSSYPFAEGERYPCSARLEEYRRTYNTRPALRLLGSLAPGR